MNIAINGFGRIGRATFKSLMLSNNKDLKVVAINDLSDISSLAHLLKYDTSYGRFEKKVETASDGLLVAGKKYKIFAEADPANLPWKELEVDIVIDSTGRFLSSDLAKKHLQAGAKKVILSAPPKGDNIKTIVMGVNEDKIKKTDKIISNASCTTNSLAPVTDVIRRSFGIQKAIMTTIHSYTAGQNLIDGPNKDPRRARAAAVNIVPTTTGAAIATTKAIPQLKGKFDGMSVRVPTPVVSLCDIVYLTKKNVTEKEVNTELKKAAKSSRLKNIIDVSEEPLVSSDYIGNSASTIVDLSLTKVVDGNLLKIITWYDNEWGYSNRLIDLIDYIKRKKLL